MDDRHDRHDRHDRPHDGAGDDAYLDPATRAERSGAGDGPGAAAPAADGDQATETGPAHGTGPGAGTGPATEADPVAAWFPAAHPAPARRAADPVSAPGDHADGTRRADDVSDGDEATTASGPLATGRGRVAAIALSVVAIVATVGVVAWWFGFRDTGRAGEPVAAAATTSAPTASPSSAATPTPTPAPTAEPTPQLATPEPQAAPAPAPTIASVPAGTVVAEGDVRSPKGSIAYHYRVVADGDDTFSTQFSGFTSTVPVTVGATFLDVTPGVGDGLTWYGVGESELGGPTATATSVTTPLGDVRQPTPYVSLVTYTSAAAPDAPVEIGTGKVLAVTPVTWSVPARQTNVAPVDQGAAQYAAGAVVATTASGAPAGYRVAEDDLLGAVAARFGVSVEALIWLNEGLEVLGDEQALFVDTTLNLDPAAR